MEHKHHGKSSESFLDTDEILEKLDFKGSETFMDAGCGDGHVAIRALKEYLPDGRAYAVDIHAPSIEEIEKQNIENLIALNADIAEGIPIEDGSVDVVLMVNVFHGFKASGQMDDVIEELKRIIKDDGKIAVVDFKAFEMERGPSRDIKSTPQELKELFAKHDLKMTYLTGEIGEDLPQGKSHYLIIFEKE